MFVFFFMFCFWFFMIIFYNIHYMLLLLVLEILLLSFFLFSSLSFVGVYGLNSLFVFLLMMVCMGGFGISLLVGVSRFYGRDFWFFRLFFKIMWSV